MNSEQLEAFDVVLEAIDPDGSMSPEWGEETVKYLIQEAGEALLVLLGGMKVGEEDAGDWTLGPDDWVVSSRGF